MVIMKTCRGCKIMFIGHWRTKKWGFLWKIRKWKNVKFTKWKKSRIWHFTKQKIRVTVVFCIVLYFSMVLSFMKTLKIVIYCYNISENCQLKLGLKKKMFVCPFQTNPKILEKGSAFFFFFLILNFAFLTKMFK